MTTGEKIIKCRKTKDLTQEQLAEILGVSRQSVSKWESDAAFPETNKLKDLAKLFNVTIDYLLNDDSEETDTENEVPTNKFKDYFKAKSTRVLYYSLVECVFFLLLFLSPILRVILPSQSIFHGNIYVDFNIYNILGAANYQTGNILILIGFLSLFGSLICGAMYSITKKRLIHIFKYICMILMFVFFMATLSIVVQNILVGFIMIVIFTVVNVVGYFFFYKFLVKEKQPEQKKKSK